MTKTILCDTDFFIALLISEDINHEKAKNILEKYQDFTFTHSSLIKYELMTVLSRKLEQNLAVKALEIFEELFENEFQFDTFLEAEIIKYYKKSKNKNQSFFDIACLVQAQKYDYKIASFDKFYPKSILIS
jgi:predicted nucleic acid-binding protein